MARAREIACSCGHTWTTKANPRVRVKCPGCGSLLLAPPVTDPWRGPGTTATPAGDEPRRTSSPDPTEAPSGGTAVVHASGTTIKATRTTPKPATARRDVPAEDLTKAQQAGRRGGLSKGTLARMGRR